MVGVRTDLNSGVHDEAGDMHGAGLAHAVGSPHCLLQNGRIHTGLQQEHMVSCKAAPTLSTTMLPSASM